MPPVNLLNVSSLNALCQTSSRLLTALQPFLYRDLVLCTGHQHVNATLKLLCDNKNLAFNVRTLTIDGTELASKFPKFPNHLIQAVGIMIKLQVMRLHCVIFNDVYDENRFLEQLKQRETPLQTFEFHSNRAHEEGGKMRSALFPLSSLTSFTWMVSEEFEYDRRPDAGPVLSILQASQETLQSISFGPAVTWKAHQQLWKMTFPRLRSLALGHWGNAQAGARSFTQFLLKHQHILEELDLTQDLRPLILENFLPFTNSSGLNAESLPHLKVLRCNLNTLWFLVTQIKLKCIPGLQKLQMKTGWGGFYKSEWLEICRSLRRVDSKQPALARLRELSLTPQYRSFSGDDAISFLDEEPSTPFTRVAEFSSCCNEVILESLKLDAVHSIDRAQLIETLRPLVRLRTLVIPMNMAMQPEPLEFFKDLVHDIALICPKLESVLISMMIGSEQEVGTWMWVNRDGEGAVTIVGV